MLSSNFCETKVEVYLPLYVAYHIKPLTIAQQRKFFAVNSKDVSAKTEINFNFLAKHLESTLSHMYLPCSIKYIEHCDRQPEFRAAYYVVKLHIPQEYLSKEPYLIKIHSPINTDDIVEIKLVSPGSKKDKDLCQYKLNETIDLRTRINREFAISQIKFFLNNKIFWKNHVPRLNSLFPNKPLHLGIKLMRDAVNQYKDIPFDRLRCIANDYCPDHDCLSTRTNLFVQPSDDLTKDFFSTVCHADSIYDLVRWISAKQELINNESSILRPITG